MGTALTYKSDTVPLLVHTCSGKGMGGLRTGAFSSDLGLMLLKQLTQSLKCLHPFSENGGCNKTHVCVPVRMGVAGKSKPQLCKCLSVWWARGDPERGLASVMSFCSMATLKLFLSTRCPHHRSPGCPSLVSCLAPLSSCPTSAPRDWKDHSPFACVGLIFRMCLSMKSEPILRIFRVQEAKRQGSPGGQWLRLCASIARDTGSIPLVKDLRSHMLHRVAKTTTKLERPDTLG